MIDLNLSIFEMIPEYGINSIIEIEELVSFVQEYFNQ